MQLNFVSLSLIFLWNYNSRRFRNAFRAWVDSKLREISSECQITYMCVNVSNYTNRFFVSVLRSRKLHRILEHDFGDFLFYQLLKKIKSIKNDSSFRAGPIITKMWFNYVSHQRFCLIISRLIRIEIKKHKKKLVKTTILSTIYRRTMLEGHLNNYDTLISNMTDQISNDTMSLRQAEVFR